MKTLINKTAVVMGGVQGIGFAIAKRFCDEGTNVDVCNILERHHL